MHTSNRVVEVDVLRFSIRTRIAAAIAFKTSGGSFVIQAHGNQEKKVAVQQEILRKRVDDRNKEFDG